MARGDGTPKPAATIARKTLKTHRKPSVGVPRRPRKEPRHPSLTHYEQWVAMANYVHELVLARLGQRATERRYLLLGEAAELARVSTSTVRYWIRQGRLQSYKPGRRLLVPRDALLQFIESQSHV